MIDPTLALIVKFSEGDSPLEVPITLVVGGFLVSGFIVSKENYMKHGPLTQSIEDGFNEVLSELPEEGKPKDDGKRRFIHLRDAHYFTPGQSPVPTVGSVFVRFKLSEVDGFHLGTLQLTPAS